MNGAPSRDEIAARLELAEARTETRFAQLSGDIANQSLRYDHKIDLLVGKIDSVAGAIVEIKSDFRTESRETRRAIWQVGIGAVLAVLALVVTLWIAGLNVQSNMIAVFQAALGVRSIPQESDVSRTPLASPAPTSASPK